MGFDLSPARRSCGTCSKRQLAADRVKTQTKSNRSLSHFRGGAWSPRSKSLIAGIASCCQENKDHSVHSHSSRNKLLLLALRKIEPKLLASDEFRQRLYSMLGRKLLLWGATRLAKIMSGFSMR